MGAWLRWCLRSATAERPLVWERYARRFYAPAKGPEREGGEGSRSDDPEEAPLGTLDPVDTDPLAPLLRNRVWTRYYRPLPHIGEDRKSTRLNSSHVAISYAVFCLKKKTSDPSTQ